MNSEPNLYGKVLPNLNKFCGSCLPKNLSGKNLMKSTFQCQQCIEKRLECQRLDSPVAEQQNHIQLRSHLTHILPKGSLNDRDDHLSSKSSNVESFETPFVPKSIIDAPIISKMAEKKATCISPKLAPVHVNNKCEILYRNSVVEKSSIPSILEYIPAQPSCSQMTTAKLVVMLRCDPTLMQGVAVLSASIFYLCSPNVSINDFQSSLDPDISHELSEIICVVWSQSQDSSEQNRLDYAKTVRLHQLRDSSAPNTMIVDEPMSSLEFSHFIINNLISAKHSGFSVKIVGDSPLVTQRSASAIQPILHVSDSQALPAASECTPKDADDSIPCSVAIKEKEDTSKVISEPDILDVDTFEELKIQLKLLRDDYIHLRARFVLDQHTSEEEFLKDFRNVILKCTGYHFVIHDKQTSKKGVISSHRYNCSQDSKKKRKGRSKGIRRSNVKMKKYECSGYLSVSFSLLTKLVNIRIRHRGHPPYKGRSSMSKLDCILLNDGENPEESLSESSHKMRENQLCKSTEEKSNSEVVCL